MKINEGDKVGVLINGEIKKGVVVSVYSDLDYAIVKFEDGVNKVMLHNIGLLPEEKDQEPKKPVEKSEITIKREDFRKIVAKVVAKVSKETGSGILGLAFISFGVDLERALFSEGEND